MKGNNNNKQTKQKHTNKQKLTQKNKKGADEKRETERKKDRQIHRKDQSFLGQVCYAVFAIQVFQQCGIPVIQSPDKYPRC